MYRPNSLSGLFDPKRQPVAKNVELDRQHPINRDLSACWLLNDNGGTKARDLSTNRLHGTYTNCSDYPWVGSQNGLVFKPDGVNDYIRVTTSAAIDFRSASAFSCTIRYYCDGSQRDSALVSCFSNAPSNYSGWMIWTNGGLTAYINGGSRAATGIPSVGWHDVALVWTGTTVLLYLDGRQVASGSYSTAPANTSAADVLIGLYYANGHEGDSTTWPWNERTSCVRLYKRALNAPEVRLLAQQPYVGLKLKGDVDLYQAYSPPLVTGNTLTAAAGTFALTGNNVGFTHARPALTAAAGTFAFTGNAVAFQLSHKLALAAGSFALTGNDAVLTGPGQHNMAAGAGTFALTGNATGLKAGRHIVAAAGSFALTGRAVRFARSLVAVLDGSSGFKRAQCAALQTPAVWACGWVSMTEISGGAAATFFAAAKTDMSRGWWIKSFYPRLSIYTADGSGSSSATSTEAIIPRPYWDFVGGTLASATDRSCWLNAAEDLGGTITGGTSRTMGDISNGETRLGIDCAGANGLTGRIKRWFAGTGSITDADKALLKAFDGINYPTLSAGVTLTNHWELDGDGRDLIGGEDMSDVGTPTYVTDTATSPTPVTARSQLITEIHNGPIYSDLPTASVVTSPVDTSGFNNLSQVIALDCLVHYGALAFKARVYWFVPTSGNGHTVLAHGGHQTHAQWDADTYGMKTALIDLNTAGHPVLLASAPGYDDAAFNSFNNTSLGVTMTDHDSYFTFLADATHNPWALFVAGPECALNYVLANSPTSAAKVSFLGLSLGADVGAILAAMDTRINHAVLLFRGSIAARRRVDTNMDGEQYPNATYWEQNEFHRSCGTSNRRFYLVYHPGDGIIGSNSYISKASYEAKFMAPMRLANPYADIQVKISTGSATHSLYHADSVDTILPALSTALTAILSGGGGALLNRRRR